MPQRCSGELPGVPEQHSEQLVAVASMGARRWWSCRNKVMGTLSFSVPLLNELPEGIHDPAVF